jgi:hypothetical protein
VARLAAVFDEKHQVLSPTGICWLNLGDSYAGAGCACASYPARCRS